MEQFRLDTGKVHRVKRVTDVKSNYESEGHRKYNKIVDIFCAITDIETEHNGAEESIREAGFI